MLRKFIDRLKGVQDISDPTFGSLRRVGPNGLLEGVAHFPPTGERVDLLVDSSTGLPTASQQAYWLELQKQYAAILPDILISLGAEQSGSGAVGEFRLVVIDLQSDDPFSGDVELTYERGDDVRSVALSGWRPRAVNTE